MRSSSAPKPRRGCGSRSSARTATGCSRARTTASASSRSTPTASSSSSSACTPRTSTLAPESACRCAARSSSTTGAGSGSTPVTEPARPSNSHCQRSRRQMISPPPSDAKPIEVLLVEDDPGDTLMIKEAFEDNKVRNRLTCVADGVQALEYLRREGEHTDAPRPDLVLLDLNLPRKDGREVLAEIKGDDELSTIPVVVLTTSAAEEDVLRSYELHANAYVTKPVDFERFIDVVRQIDEFFVTVVKLPGQ